MVLVGCRVVEHVNIKGVNHVPELLICKMEG